MPRPSPSKLRPLLEGKRIYLREVRVSDVTPAYYRWMNDPDVTRYLGTRYPPQSKEQIAKYVQRTRDDTTQVFFAIIVKRGDRHIGNIKVGPINWQHRRGAISLIIGEKAHWGRGYATEAIELVTRFAFDTLNLHKLEAGCVPENVGSERAFLRVGFKREAVLPEHWFIDGRYLDQVWLGLTRKGD